MKENDNSYEVIYKYDKFSDILGIKVTREFQYDETVEMDDGLLLDFDVNNIPTALEMHDASKRLNVPPESLDNILFLKMNISVDVNSIAINAIFGLLIKNMENKCPIHSITSNFSHIPEIEAELIIWFFENYSHLIIFLWAVIIVKLLELMVILQSSTST